MRLRMPALMVRASGDAAKPGLPLAGQAARVDVSVAITARVFLQEASEGGRGHERSCSPPPAFSLSSCLSSQEAASALDALCFPCHHEQARLHSPMPWTAHSAPCPVCADLAPRPVKQ